MIKTRKDISNTRLGRLLVINRISDRNGHVYYNCLCDCGKTRNIRYDNLSASNGTKSCGCLKIEALRNNGKRNAKDISVCFKYLYHQYRNRAKYDQIYFAITDQFFSENIMKNCYYCNSIPSNRYTSKAGLTLMYSGLDRVDSTKGYVESNIVPCCWICNNAKKDMPYNEFIDWINRLVLFRTATNRI